MKKQRAPPPPPPPPPTPGSSRNNDPNKYPTLDLHGYRKDKALRAVTDFLEQQSRKNNNAACWVLIITGTGSHSPAGPVLRTAVESLLQRRRMQFVRNTPGSFCVQATSGDVWYHQQATAVDTKVIVAHPQHDDDYALMQHMMQRSNNSQTRGRKAFLSHSSGPTHRVPSGGGDSDGTTASSASSSSKLSLGGPSVAEVAQDEANMEQAKEASRQAAVQHARMARKVAQDDLQKALQASLLETTPATNHHDENNDAELQKAMALSQQEHEQQVQQEQAMWEQALEASKTTAAAASVTMTDEQVEALTQQALALSLQERRQQSACQEQPDEEEARLLQEILQRSLYETVGP